MPNGDCLDPNRPDTFVMEGEREGTHGGVDGSNNVDLWLPKEQTHTTIPVPL